MNTLTFTRIRWWTLNKSTNEPPIPTALIQREKEVREWHQKRQAQEEKRQQMYEDEKSDFSRQEINELEELLASGTKSENCFASMPKGYGIFQLNE